jgi:hypothetical protein
VFTTLHFFLLICSIVAIPGFSAMRFSAERADGNDSDLLFITTITPGAIIRGKYWASMALIGLFFTASLPFMAMTYFLRGVDLLTIFYVVGFSLVFASFMVLIQLLLAGGVTRSSFRSILSLFNVIFLFWFMGMIAEVSSSFIRSGAGARILQKDFWFEAIPVLVMIFTGKGLCYALGISAISPPSSNYMHPVRVLASLIWLGTGLLLAWFAATTSSVWPMVGWTILSILAAIGNAMVSSCERDRPSPRILRERPQGSLARAAYFLVSTGAANGLLWSLAIIIGTGAGGFLFHHLTAGARIGSSGQLREAMFEMGTGGLFALGYCLLAVLFRRVVLGDRVSRSSTWFVALILAGICGSVPYLIGQLFFASDDDIWLIANPFMVTNSRMQDTSFRFALFSLIGLILLQFGWFKAQWSAFMADLPPSLDEVLTPAGMGSEPTTTRAVAAPATDSSHPSPGQDSSHHEPL